MVQVADMRLCTSTLEVTKMAELKYVKELLSTSLGTEGSLLIPRKIYDQIIDEAAKALIPRTEAGWYFGPGDIPGSSIDLNLLTENSMSVRLVAEASEVTLDQTAYSAVRYSQTIVIAHSLLNQPDCTINCCVVVF